MKVNAVVLAGGDGAIIDPTVEIKGLVPVAGKPMVEWVVEALRGASHVNEIAVVVPTGDGLGRWVDKADKVVISKQAFVDNLLAGVDSFRDELSILIATGDLPALTSAAVDDFVGRSLERQVDVSYPLVPKADMVEQFPGSERTYIKIVGGPVTGGNMMLLTPGVVHGNRDIGQRLFETRKSPIKMAKLLGPVFIVKLMSGRLDPADVEKKMEQLVGGKCAAIYTSHASIGADVDKPVDVVVAERVLYERNA